ncbi:uncharacterized protein C8Q71DRAFT_247265 [Rhodofomes roseus]|uniref:Uncharacterized protein n=1 Tax=Rhodofomes roseus TaxID=34475 RepID=A0ABQ8K6X6_9APHY|nr:uncharacterized protein C8Q71DRAFT_247265 [Rhodofomes roseus]KAH9833005.1 hypothetical protein C8Q71DRAFT_247265 [Rhodofomes roseus]
MLVFVSLSLHRRQLLFHLRLPLHSSRRTSVGRHRLIECHDQHHLDCYHHIPLTSMFSLRLFKADHPGGTRAEDLVRELARKPHPRYLECKPAVFVQPTPYRPHLDGRVKFAAILGGEWGVCGAEARAENTNHIAVDEGHHDLVYTWPPVLSSQTRQQPTNMLQSQDLLRDQMSEQSFGPCMHDRAGNYSATHRT